ncbi:hypothetical protein D3C87_1801590 [compost metagenome]
MDASGDGFGFPPEGEGAVGCREVRLDDPPLAGEASEQCFRARPVAAVLDDRTGTLLRQALHDGGADAA